MVQSKSDTRIKRYGLFNTEAAILDVKQTELQMYLNGYPKVRRVNGSLIKATGGECWWQLARIQQCRS